MWLTRICSLILVLGSSIAYATDDLTGSADDGVLERFRGSWIVNYKTAPLTDYALPLGGVEQVNGVERLEREERITGRLTRISYRIPEGNKTRKVFNFFKTQLEMKKAEILFSCQGRECGSSNYWANDVFDFSKLYGVERSQYYLAARLPGVTVLMYTVERGNRKLYAHIDVIETDAVARITTTIKREGYVGLSVNQLPDMGLLEKLVSQLETHTQDITLVVHHKGETLALGGELGTAKALQLRQALTGRQMAGVSVQSVGALAPSVLKQNQMVVVLVSGAP
ncbi:DUF4892 domain-containing protein [Neptunomonas japonica]|uniref:DUF4892 domain-containing protein n=1 Tax=Neptunomonas japonica TaxID=417574 RepID=UPI00041B8E23|nr:DUF4892 domain-containing protein [Neptunomonas japonica]